MTDREARMCRRSVVLRRLRAVWSSSVASAARIVGVFLRATGNHSLDLRRMWFKRVKRTASCTSRMSGAWLLPSETSFVSMQSASWSSIIKSSRRVRWSRKSAHTRTCAILCARKNGAKSARYSGAGTPRIYQAAVVSMYSGLRRTPRHHMS
jgi:hypothetical protein